MSQRRERKITRVEYICVVEIDGMFISYLDAETSGDMSVQERGFDFDPGAIHEVEPVEKVVIVYERIERRLTK